MLSGEAILFSLVALMNSGAENGKRGRIKYGVPEILRNRNDNLHLILLKNTMSKTNVALVLLMLIFIFSIRTVVVLNRDRSIVKIKIPKSRNINGMEKKETQFRQYQVRERLVFLERFYRRPPDRHKGINFHQIVNASQCVHPEDFIIDDLFMLREKCIYLHDFDLCVETEKIAYAIYDLKENVQENVIKISDTKGNGKQIIFKRIINGEMGWQPKAFFHSLSFSAGGRYLAFLVPDFERVRQSQLKIFDLEKKDFCKCSIKINASYGFGRNRNSRPLVVWDNTRDYLFFSPDGKNIQRLDMRNMEKTNFVEGILPIGIKNNSFLFISNASIRFFEITIIDINNKTVNKKMRFYHSDFTMLILSPDLEYLFIRGIPFGKNNAFIFVYSIADNDSFFIRGFFDKIYRVDDEFLIKLDNKEIFDYYGIREDSLGNSENAK